jgi:hypothetical protein
MVKSGSPRWQGYLFYAICLFTGIFFILTVGPDGFDLFAYGGVVLIIIAAMGIAETWRGRPFTRIYGGPAKKE